MVQIPGKWYLNLSSVSPRGVAFAAAKGHTLGPRGTCIRIYIHAYVCVCVCVRARAFCVRLRVCELFEGGTTLKNGRMPVLGLM